VGDCGVVPVVDSEDRVVGMVTDRDICMAAYTHAQPLWQIRVSDAMAKEVHGVRENALLESAEGLIRQLRIRRVPVVDREGRLKGILSTNDLARHAHRSAGHKHDGLSGDRIVRTLAAICEPRGAATTNGSPVPLST
jgi:CBS-domain-containing membrane protein